MNIKQGQIFLHSFSSTANTYKCSSTMPGTRSKKFSTLPKIKKGILSCPYIFLYVWRDSKQGNWGLGSLTRVVLHYPICSTFMREFGERSLNFKI